MSCLVRLSYLILCLRDVYANVMNEKNILEVHNLCISAVKDGEQRPLVENISFSLEKGKVLGIVGESGSGKSITCYAITGLLNPNLRVSGGEVLFRQGDRVVNLTTLPEKHFRRLRGERITMVFQEPMSALNPVQRCGAQVEEVLKIHTRMSAAERKAEVLKLFEQVKLPDPQRIYNSYPHQISGGQKQRVVIAMAIACRPDVIIADEPTTALDVTVQKEIVNLLSEISRTTNMAIIFITHDLALISEIADDVLVMYRGHIEEQGTKRDIFLAPHSPYTKGLLACRPQLGRKVNRLPVVADFVDGRMPEGAPLTEEQIITHEAEVEQRAPLLRIRGVSKWYRNGADLTRAVQGVNLDIYKGETLGLVGESGCGKSTFSRAILMLDPPSEGEVFYRGKDITRLSSKEIRNLRREIQIIFQDPFASLNPMLSVGEALIEPMQVHHILDNDRQRREYIADLLKKVGLSPEVSTRYPHQFSGGQRQRIGIARALVLQPSFIICDESVSALDVSVQAQVLNLLNDLKEDFGFTYLFISHDLSVVQYMSDHLAVMQGGRIVEYGRTDVVYKNPQSSYTQRLMDAIPRVRVE